MSVYSGLLYDQKTCSTLGWLWNVKESFPEQVMFELNLE